MAMLPKKDVVIVGYGAAAGPLSVELARAGFSVVALERGPHLRTEPDFIHSLDTLRHKIRNELIPPVDRLPMTFRTDPSGDAVPAENRMPSLVGGGSVTSAAFAWRYYADDFRVGSTIEERYGGSGRVDYLKEDGAALVDWPLSYDDLEPYYEKVEYHVGVGGWPGNLRGTIRPANPDEGNPFEAPRQNDYPFRPLRDNATGLTFRRGALELGLHPFHSPTAIVTEAHTSPYGVSRHACTYCSLCASHPCWNGAKSSTLSAMLPAAVATRRFELRPDCHVLRINRRGDRAVSVEYLDAAGGLQVQPGEIFILAAYTFQNVRLLLVSGIAGHGIVGKYFMNRAGPAIHAVFDDRHLNGYAGPGVQAETVDDFNGENAAEEKLGLPNDEFFIRGGMINSTCQRNPLETYQSVPPDVPRWGPAYKAYLRESFSRYMALYVAGEALPYETSYIDLDATLRDRHGIPAARVQRQVKRNEIRMARFLYRKSVETLRAAGASQVWGRDAVVPVATMTHDLGGCRMGADPQASVTNRYGQMWEVPNLFVAGGALFPTMSGYNPTHTIWALSFWTADALLKQKVDLADARQHR